MCTLLLAVIYYIRVLRKREDCCGGEKYSGYPRIGPHIYKLADNKSYLAHPIAQKKRVWLEEVLEEDWLKVLVLQKTGQKLGVRALRV